MARPPEDPETLEPGFLFEWYINPTFPSPFYVAGGSGVAPAAATRSPVCDSDSDSDSGSDGSGSARGVEDAVRVGPGAAAGGGAESGPRIDLDRRESVSESARRAAADEADPLRAGLRVVSIDSDSDSEYLESENVCSFDLESQRNLAAELEWEEVSEQAHDRDEEEVTVSSENFTEELEGVVASAKGKSAGKGKKRRDCWFWQRAEAQIRGRRWSSSFAKSSSSLRFGLGRRSAPLGFRPARSAGGSDVEMPGRMIVKES